jgi:hypothetical protein
MCFYDGLLLSFSYLQRCFLFMLFLHEENAAKAEKNDHKNGILNHKNQRKQFWTASSNSFSEDEAPTRSNCGLCLSTDRNPLLNDKNAILLPFSCHFRAPQRPLKRFVWPRVSISWHKAEAELACGTKTSGTSSASECLQRARARCVSFVSRGALHSNLPQDG